MQRAAVAATPSSADAIVLVHAQVRRRVALVLMVLSGFAGLGYQIVWTQQSALWLGHEAAAVLAVVAAFFGGLTCGALVLGSRVARSPIPGRWYAACEVVVGLWSLALAVLMAPLTDSLLDVIGAEPAPVWHWTVAFCGIFLLLLPATAAMGATLPAMERVLAKLRLGGAPIAALYAGNTFGAVLGVLGVAFVLVPQLGLVRTAAVCAALNLVCAVTAVKFFGERTHEVRAATQPPEAAHSPAPGLLVVLAATGLLGIGYEVLMVRVLSQIAENTVYTFAILLAVYLIGTALGAAAYGRWRAQRRSVADEPARCRDWLLRTLATACMLGILSLANAAAIRALLLHAFGAGMTAALATEAALAAAAFLLPTIVMGALFSHLGAHAAATGSGFGRALGVNTLGAAFAPVLFGLLLLPLLGTKLVLLLVAAGYLALSSRRAWLAPAQWAAAGAMLALVVWGPSLAIVDVPDGGRVVRYTDGAMATVSIVEDARGIATLHIDNRQQEGSSATVLADARQAWLPVLLHPAPRRALFLGLGTGVTAAAAAADPLLHVDAVELLPEVIAASAYFTGELRDVGNASRLHVLNADARRFVRASGERYDVIVADNFHPARSGSGSLYTVEHFAAVRDRLEDGGVFCQWLPLHQLDLDTLRSIVQTFRAVYPDGWAMLATNSLDTPVVGLVARRAVDRFDVEQVRARLAGAGPLALAQFGITDDLALLGSFIAGPNALAKFAGSAALNTDDRPVVAYQAPRNTYAPESLARDRLIGLLQQVDIRPAELLAASRATAWDLRLAAYWSARDRFLDVGRNVQPTSDVRRMLMQVRKPLLAVLQISPDFRPAYDPLLRMASDLGRTDAAAAHTLLLDLQHAQPSRPEAAHVMRDLAAAQ